MRFLLIFTVMIALVPDMVAQEVVRKDGTTVQGKPSIRYRAPDSVFVKVGEELIPAYEVYGHPKSSKDMFLYLIPISDPDSRRVEWAFRERSLDGEIALYAWTRNDTGTERKIIMAHRGEQFGFVYSSHIDSQSNKEMAERLKSLAGDVPSLAGALDSITTQPTFEGVFNFVKRYDIERFSPQPIKAAQAPVVFFARPTNKVYSFSVVIDEVTQYKMSTKSPLQVSLPHDQLVKACVSMGDFKDCMLVRATSCCRQNIMVSMDPKKGGLQLAFSNEEVAIYYINRERVR